MEGFGFRVQDLGYMMFGDVAYDKVWLVIPTTIIKTREELCVITTTLLM